MTRPAGRALPLGALAALVGLALGLQVHGIAGQFLSDDLAHLHVIYGNAERGTLLSWTMARFYEPLGNGALSYRPLAFATYVLDWLAYGDDARGWRVTSLVVFAMNAVAAGVLATRWLSGASASAKLAGAISGSLVFMYPFAGEITYWLAGRFDLLAGLFTLLYLISLPLDRPSSTGEHLLRILWLAGGLMSKESALPLPAIATLLVLAHAATLRHDARWLHRGVRGAAAAMWPSWVIVLAYLAGRLWLFGSVWKVYPTSTPPADIVEWWERTSGIGTIVHANVGAHALPWALATLLLAVTIGWQCFRARRDISRSLVALMITLLCAIALYVVAPGMSFPVSAAGGEGARHFYIAWIYLSLLCGVAAVWQRSALVAGIALAALMLAGQTQSLVQWQSAGRVMRDVVAGVGRIAPTVGDDQYALLLLPDHIGVALFARSAQGAIGSPPMQAQDYLPRVAVMLGADFGLWSEYVVQGKIDHLKSTTFDPARFLGLYCWNDAKREFVPLTGGELVGDAVRWRAEAQHNFRAAGCIEPF